MSLVLFAGPTLAGAREVPLPVGARLLGPARCGDIYLAAKLSHKQRPATIVLVDGYFDHQLSVWHKEILWALSEGVSVYGAASMGALRAAELAPFGMIGVGKVYEQFASGELEDDDEVAVIHEAAERGYTPRSDAMVNLRATFAAALAAGKLTQADLAQLIATGKGMHYADRTARAVIASAHQLEPEKRKELQGWVSSQGVVDQKGQDVLELLSILADPQAPGASTHGQPLSPPAQPFKLSETNYWRVLREQLDGQLSRNGDQQRDAKARGVARPAS